MEVTGQTNFFDDHLERDRTVMLTPYSHQNHASRLLVVYRHNEEIGLRLLVDTAMVSVKKLGTFRVCRSDHGYRQAWPTDIQWDRVVACTAAAEEPSA
jgi:hypothetical protein